MLPCGELPQALERLIHFLCAPRGGLLLHGLVLVAHAIVLEFEQVREVLGALAAATAATAATRLALLHLHIAIERIGALEVAERALLEGERRTPIALAEVLLGGLHLLGGAHQRVVDLLEHRVTARDAALLEALRERLHFLAQTPLRDRQRGHVLVPLPFRA